MTTSFKNALGVLVLSLMAAAPLSGCNDTASSVVVTNGYGDAVVQKVWWNQTLILGAIDPGATSAAQRAVPGSDFAYALISLGWPPDPQSGPIALRSMQQLSAARGAELAIDVFDTTFAGNCAATTGLDEETARFITERIFPGDFAGGTYDAAGCETIPTPDGGSD